MFGANYAPLGGLTGQDCKIVQVADCNVMQVCGVAAQGAGNHVPKAPFKVS